MIPESYGVRPGPQWVATASSIKDERFLHQAMQLFLGCCNGGAFVFSVTAGQLSPSGGFAGKSPLLCSDHGDRYFVAGRENGHLLLWRNGEMVSWDEGTYNVGGRNWDVNMPKSPVRALSVNPRTKNVAFGNDDGDVFVGEIEGWWKKIHGKADTPSMVIDPSSGIAAHRIRGEEIPSCPVSEIMWLDAVTLLVLHINGICWRLRIRGALPNIEVDKEPYHHEFNIASLGSIPRIEPELAFIQQRVGSTLMNLETGQSVAHWPVLFRDRIGAFIKASPTDKVWAASSGSQFFMFRLEGDTDIGMSSEPDNR